MFYLVTDQERTMALHGMLTSSSSVPQAEVRGRILIVDDDPSVRKFLMEALAEAGHSVALAEDGEQAIAKIRAEAFDLVVTDIVMSQISGWDVLQAVKRDCPATEVILMTAHASIDNAIQALREGAYDFLTKPLQDLELFCRVVERALEKRRLETENRLLVEKFQTRNVELRETVASLGAINEIGKTVTGLFDLNELYDSVVRIVAEHLQARRVSIFVCEPDSETMTLVASAGVTKQEALESRVQVGKGIAGRVAASQEPLLVEDIDRTELKSLRRGTGYRTPSFLIAPLRVPHPIRYQRKRVGVINACDKRSGDPFNEQDLEFVSTLSSQVAVAIEHARLGEMVTHRRDGS